MELAHHPLIDPIIQDRLQYYLTSQTMSDINLANWNIENYVVKFLSWIQHSSYNQLHGLDAFANTAYCAGALEGIANFVHRHAVKRRLRFSRAEFVGSKIACNHAQANWLFLEDAKLAKNDAVIISLPFSGNGGHHNDYDNIIEYCNKNNVPVLLDMAYYGISYNIKVDVDQPCISDIVFSLSKCFSVPMRLGLRLTRHEHDDLIQVNSNMKLINRWAVNAGIKLLNDFDINWLVDRYRPLQHAICMENNLEITNTLTLALGQPVVHDNFMRNGYRRVCITDELLQRV